LCILSETPNDPRSTVDKQKRDKKQYTSKINQEDPSPRRFNFREAVGDEHHKSNPRHASNRPQQYSQHADSLRSFLHCISPYHNRVAERDRRSFLKSMKGRELCWWELIPLAVQIALIAMFGVMIWLIVFEE